MLCTGDMGFAAAKCYDIECGCRARDVPRDLVVQQLRGVPGAAREHQVPADGKGKAEFVHTLNGSGLAVGRTLVAILENYQEKDGTITIPEALRPWMGGQERIAGK